MPVNQRERSDLEGEGSGGGDGAAAFRSTHCRLWELMQWCELRAWLLTDLSKEGALPYLGIYLRWAGVKIWLPQALYSHSCLKRLFPVHTEQAGQLLIVTMFSCLWRLWSHSCLKSCWSVFPSDVTGPNAEAVEAYITCPRSPAWKERSWACCLWRRCFSHGREVFSSEQSCENQPGGACWLLFGFLCLSKRRSECIRFPLECNCAFSP